MLIRASTVNENNGLFVCDCSIMFIFVVAESGETDFGVIAYKWKQLPKEEICEQQI